MLVVAFVVVTIIMIFVIPAFKSVFTSFGADLPAPTLLVIAISEFFVKYWWLIFGVIGGGAYFFFQAWRRSEKMQMFMDRLLLRLPVFGDLINKSVIARWTRTLSTMFAAGVPLVEALDSVGGASGNAVYRLATAQIQKDVSTGSALTTAMTQTGVFPTMVIQMCAIGEESGALDQMLGKAAGIDLVHVPYKGASAAVTDLVGGQVQVSVQSLPSSISFIKSGKIKVLGVVNEKRVPALPDSPTIGETVKGFGTTPWYGMFVPAGTPKSIIQQLNAEIAKALESKDAIERLAGVGCEPFKSSPEQFATLVRDDLPRWAKIVKDAGATVD